jgi:steroid delta-isomerase-like uncharacterized protein
LSPELRALFDDVWESLWTRGDPAAVDRLMTEDYVRHTLRGKRFDREQLKVDVASLRDAFPDLVTTIQDIFAEGDRVCVRWIARGTHSGEYQGAPVTDREAVLAGLTVSRVEGDRIAEDWVSWDELEMLETLGVIRLGQRRGLGESDA